MGYDPSLFVTAPDASLVCSICQDVLEDPRSLRCGHSFCAGCLRDQAAAHTARRQNGGGRTSVHPKCPTCRGPGKDSFPNFVAKEMISGLKISCMNNCGNGGSGNDIDNQRSGAADAGDNSEEGRRVRRRPNDDEDTNAIANAKCNWTGRLDEWKHHADHQCCLQLISCDVSGCGAECRRDEMADHQRSAACVDARIAAQVSAAVAAMDKKYQELQKKHAAVMDKKYSELQKKHTELEKKYHEKVALGGNSGFVIKFCSDWMIRKPDPLFGFVVYREAMPIDDTRSYLNKDITKLLVGIPGPKRTVWEGGLYPVVFDWKNGPKKPPYCKLPKGFHHPNVYPSGTICLTTLNEEEGFRPDYTIPELMFDIQQLFAHPYMHSPAQSAAWICLKDDKNKYDQIATELAQTYTPERFAERANEDNDTQWVPVEDSLQEPKEAPIEPAIVESNQPAVDKGQNYIRGMGPLPCTCSCCAWGTATGLWDRRLQMRFLWGIG